MNWGLALRPQIPCIISSALYFLFDVQDMNPQLLPSIFILQAYLLRFLAMIVMDSCPSGTICLK